MINKLAGIPDYVAGFTASGQVTREDYDNFVIPEIKRIANLHGHIHFILVLTTDAANSTIHAWMSDALAGLKHLAKWKKMAVVTVHKGVDKITEIISPVIPGKSKGFVLAQLDDAKAWVSAED